MFYFGYNLENVETRTCSRMRKKIKAELVRSISKCDRYEDEQLNENSRKAEKCEDEVAILRASEEIFKME